MKLKRILHKNIKVGVITFHNTSNYGAALQAFATVAALRKLGYTAEVIDYTSKYRRGLYTAIGRVSEAFFSGNIIKFFKVLVMSPGIFFRNIAFKKFYKEFPITSKSRYQTSVDLAKSNDLYDVIIAGSDQIWSYKNNFYDYNYLLEFAAAKKWTVSYASSFGLLDVPEELQVKYKSLLDRFNYISVRESRGVEIVTELTGREPFLAIDPVLLHSPKFWSRIGQNSEFSKGEFDVYYFNDRSHRHSKVFKYYSANKDIKKVSIGSFLLSDIFDRKTYIRNYRGPQAFINFIKDARTVYTTSFHAVVFCLIFNVQFYVFLSGDGGRDSRILSFLHEFGLSHRAIFENDTEVDAPLDEVADFNIFNTQWSARREECLGFLDMAIKSLGEEQ